MTVRLVAHNNCIFSYWCVIFAVQMPVASVRFRNDSSCRRAYTALQRNELEEGVLLRVSPERRNNRMFLTNVEPGTTLEELVQLCTEAAGRPSAVHSAEQGRNKQGISAGCII